MDSKNTDYLEELAQIAFQLGIPKGATPLELPQGLNYLENEWKGQTVWMESKAWTHPVFRLIRYTRLFSEGRISTFNWVVYPHDCYDAPIFASDFVVGADKLRIAVIDAMPLFPHEKNYANQWITPFADLHQESLSIAPAFERKLSWSTRYLGVHACLSTGITAIELSPLVALWKAYIERYWERTQHISPVSAEREAAVRAWHQSYNQAPRAVEDRRNPYLVYFGETLGKRYNAEFLFSDTFGRA